MDGCFITFVRVFQSNQDAEKVIMDGFVHEVHPVGLEPVIRSRERLLRGY